MSRNGDHYEDSHDMIERIRKLREAAEQKMNAFGDPAEYDVRIIRGPATDKSADDPNSAIQSGDGKVMP